MTPAVRVELYTGGFIDPYLTLDDPVRGELDEAAYPLYDGSEPDATVALEAESYAYAVSRGRKNELDEMSVGTLAINFRNYSGAFVPSSLIPADTWSTYGDVIMPGKRVRLYLDEIPVFDGRVDDWELDYDVSGEASARLVAFDPLGVLAQQTLDAFTATSQTASERIVAVLDRPEVEFSSNRDITTSSSAADLAADSVTDATNAWTYVKLVTYSDLGFTFATREGLLAFRPRQSVTFSVSAEFADDGTGIPFSGVRPSSSSRYIYNRVTVTRVGGTAQTVEDTTSQAAYGLRALDVPDLLMNSDVDALNLAGSLLSFYKEPATRIESIDVNLGSLSSAERSQVLALELGDYVTVTWTPTGTAQVVVSCRVEGIDIGGAYNSLGVVTLSLSPASYFPNPFLLDDLTWGVLDTSHIYY